MTIDLGAPGVRFERRRVAPLVPALRTDITAFIGLADRGPDHRPIAVELFEEFKAVFGGFSANAFLAYAVKAYFDNGGARAWIVRVTSDDPGRGAASASGWLTSGGSPSWTVATSSPGQWGNSLSISVQPGRRRIEQSAPSGYDAASAQIGRSDGFERGTHVRLSQPGGPTAIRVVARCDRDANRIFWVDPDLDKQLPYDTPIVGFDRNRPLDVETLSYTLTVRERGRLVEIHDDLALVPEHPRFAPQVLRIVDTVEADRAPPRIALTPPDLPGGLVPPALDDDPAIEVVLAGGRDGLAMLRIEDFIGDVAAGGGAAQRGLQAAGRIEEAALLAMPDIHVRAIDPPASEPEPPGDPCDPCAPPAVAPPAPPSAGDRPPIFSDADVLRAQAAMIDLCERLRDRFAILDAPHSAARDDATGLGPIAAWRERFDSAFGALYYPWAEVPNPIGASPLRAIPPCGHVAGQVARLDLEVGVHRPPANVPLSWLPATTAPVSEGAHALLNPLGINVIRARAGLGLRVLGARTLSSDPLWRFVNVRRLISMICKAVDIGSQWAVFEPNNDDTRATLAATLSAFLMGLWQRGSFVGADPAESFAVRCDETNNPPEARANGELRVDLSVAPVNPFEFVVLRLGHIDGTLRIDELVVRPAGGAS